MDKEKIKIYQKMIKKGINQRKNIEDTMKEILGKDIKNIFLVGCGGSLAVMNPLKYILETNSSLPTYIYNSSEFLAIKPKNFNEDSLVITSSYSGKTKETVDSSKYAKEVGAITIGFTGEADSPLGKSVDYVFANKADEGVTDSKMIMLYQIIFNILKYKDDYKYYDEMMEVMDKLPELLVDVKYKVEDRAEKFAANYQDADFFMTLGAGPLWGMAYTYATCILEEMQWIHAQPVHSGEYFHGAFEIVREDTNLILFKGEDKTRSLAERAEKFSEKYSNNLIIIDTKEFELPGIPSKFRGYFSPLFVSSIMDVFSKKLADKRDHPLETRKYMGKVEY
ncbi:MAG: SIS domain-containing protein [Halanaerobiales bacterium]